MKKQTAYRLVGQFLESLASLEALLGIDDAAPLLQFQNVPERGVQNTFARWAEMDSGLSHTLISVDAYGIDNLCTVHMYLAEPDAERLKSACDVSTVAYIARKFLKPFSEERNVWYQVDENVRFSAIRNDRTAENADWTNYSHPEMIARGFVTCYANALRARAVDNQDKDPALAQVLAASAKEIACDNSLTPGERTQNAADRLGVAAGMGTDKDQFLRFLEEKPNGFHHRLQDVYLTLVNANL